MSADSSDRLEFYVKDTGIGVPKYRLQAIFDRFVQADISDSRAFQGAGLGLSISKAYVHMLGGEIWVESKEGQGSVFYFTLPYYPLKERAWPKDSNKFSIDVTAAKKLKILIVEDDEISQMLISIAFIKYSKVILKADNGNDAVEICRNNPDMDIVFMDIKLPGIDGYETTRLIRSFNNTVYIIAQTAYGLINERETALRAGCNEFVPKPLNISFLKEFVHAQFEK
jgi:CheY-like chemotaxis protein